MGYSIMTEFENVKQKEMMVVFLEKEFKRLDTLCDDKTIKKMIGENEGLPSEELAYGPKENKHVIGFNYGAGSSEFERNYFYTICYWMAIAAGVRKNFGMHQNMPYINYDGVEEWAVFLNEKPEKSVEFGWVSTNEHGFRENPELRMIKERNIFIKLLFWRFTKKVKKVDKVIKQELERLTNEWKKTI